MSKERFEIFGKIIKDNEEVPNLLDNYLATVRLNEFNEKIKDLQSQLDQANERLKEIDNFKYNYGYTNYEDNYMLEDLQSRAFQGEDDTAVVESLFDFFDICDENEILPKVEEMNEKLKCAIVPKFKIGQEVWAISVLRLNNIDSFIITEICYCADYGLYYKTNLGINLYEYYFDVFATLEEATNRLRKLKEN